MNGFEDGLTEKELLVQMRTTQIQMERQMNSLVHSIEGIDGRPGLKDRVMALECARISWIQVGMFAVALGGVLVALFKK